MERSLLLAKKYQHLKVTDDQRVQAEIETIAPSYNPSTKSEAIDSLIAQNEDLTARLKVLLRRLSSIEEENYVLSQEHREMKHQLSAVTDQLSVFKEKENDLRDRSLAAEETLEIQQSQLRAKEIEFAKLRTQEWEYREHLKSQLELVEKQFKKLYRYRARIKQIVRPSYKNLKLQINEKDSKIEQHKKEIQNTEIQCQTLIHKNLEIVKKSRESVKQIEEEKLQLIAQFEQALKDQQIEVQSIKDLNLELRKKAALLDKSLERQDFLENRLIYSERENKELREKYNEEYSQLQNQFYEWRMRAQGLEAEKESLVARVHETEAQYSRTKEIADRLDEQMESLRILWKEKVHENERLKRNQETLETLNTELSIKINELRACEILSK